MSATIDEREGKTFADRYPDSRDKDLWCIDCGESARSEALTWWQECATCAQWWRDHPLSQDTVQS